MTALLLYNYVLVELNKVDAPNILLEDFNYFVNKAINLWINKRYNIYDVNQQTTDDVRVLKSTAILDAKKKPYTTFTNSDTKDFNNMFDFMGATYEVELPADYLHILNCVCIYHVIKDPKGCYDNPYQPFPAKRLTADSWSEVLGNYWNLPKYYRPYYYIHNVNLNVDVPTNPYRNDNFAGLDFGKGYGTDVKYDYNRIKTLSANSVDDAQVYIWTNKNSNKYTVYDITDDHPSDNYGLHKISKNGDEEISDTFFVGYLDNDSNNLRLYELNDNEYVESTHDYSFAKPDDDVTVSKVIDISGLKKDYVNREAGNRYGNISKVLMEIRYGADDRDFKLEKVAVDYIKTPQHILLTQSQVDRTTDTSLVLEFPDYVCQEILNELVLIILEHNSDRRIETQPLVSLSIANPVQQLTNQPTARAVQNS